MFRRFLARIILRGRSMFRCFLARAILRGQSDISFDISPRGDRIVFTGSGEGLRDLYLLDLISLRVTRVAETPDYESDPAFSPDSKLLAYAASPDAWEPAQIFVRSLVDNAAKQLTTGSSTYDCAPSFSCDGSRVAFARAHRHRPY